MNKALLVVLALIVVIVFIIAAVFLYLHKQAASPSDSLNPSPVVEQTAQDPAAFVQDFYHWYINGLAQDQNFDTSAQFNAQITQWVTPQFKSQWSTLVEQTDSNPVLLAQDYGTTWPDHIDASVVTQSTQAATVAVVLGTGNDVHRLTVQLAKTSSGWRISSVAVDQ